MLISNLNVILFQEKSITRKRKAEDSVESKDNVNQINPFAIIPKKEIQNESAPRKTPVKANPFMGIEPSKKSSPEISENNDFISLKRKKLGTSTTQSSKSSAAATTRTPPAASTRTPPTPTNRNQSSNISRLLGDRSWDFNDNDIWRSKNTASDVKVEKEEDPDMQQYIDMFKDKIVIDVLKVVPRIRKSKDVTDGNVTSQVNYKNFKKVIHILFD